MSPRQPMFEFLIEFNNRHEALEPEIRTLTDAAWEHFLELISAVNLAHCAQPRIREGTWYLRHSLVAAQQEVTACAKSALDAVQKIKEQAAGTGIKNPGFENLADYAIAFAQSICEDPQFLSIETPAPSSSVRSSEVPQI